MATESNEVPINQGTEASPQESKPVLFERLVPILFVVDLQAERDFYISLGFNVTYQGTEFPDFIALGLGTIEFGISLKQQFTPELPDRVLTWQIGVRDIEAVKLRLTASAIAFREEWITPSEDWKYRVLHARTPNGYTLLLEGPKE